MWRAIMGLAFALLLLLIVFAIVTTYLSVKWGRELQTQLAEIPARGEPVTMAQVAPKPVPVDENAAELYQQVFQVSFSPTPSSPPGPRSVTDPEETLCSQYALRPTPALEGRVGAILGRSAVRADLARLRSASRRPYSVFPVDWSQGPAIVFPHMARFRRATQLVAAQAVLLARQGRSQEALGWWGVSLRMSDHAASEPTLIGQLVGYSMQATAFRSLRAVLDDLRIPPESAARMDETLRSIDLRATLIQALQTERVWGMSVFQVHASPGKKGMGGVVGRSMMALYELGQLETMERALEIVRDPCYLAAPRLRTLARDIHHGRKYVLARNAAATLLPSVMKRDSSIANIDLCRIALALKAYEYQRHAYPATLGELKATIHWTIPKDPFSGKNYVYHRQGEGFIIYSLGENMKDDGGRPEYDPQGKYRPDTSDIVWQCAR
jgi:hypothetical protein